MAKVILPEGYGAAAPYAKKGAAVYATKKRRRRAARVLRRSKKKIAGYGAKA